MLSNKKFNIALALLIAIGLWAYVIGETNPQDTRTYRDIPIQLINGETLEAAGLAVKSVSAERMAVSLTGTRASVNRINPKDITATVDLADAAEGENQLKINLRVPDDVEIEDKSLNKVTIEVEKRVSKEMEIVPYYRGTFGNEQEPVTVEMNRRTVTVTGAESLVSQVDHVQAAIGEGEVTEKMKTIGSKLVPVDQDGREVKHLELSAGSVQITAELASVKTVSLEVPIIDNSGDEIQRRITAPKTITIKGKTSTISGIQQITAQPVDISEITESTQIEIIPILPEDVQVSSKSAGNLFVTVDVQAMEEKTFAFDMEDVELVGLSEELNAQLRRTGRIEVVILGTKAAVDNIEKSDIALSVDLTDLKEGAHQVLLQAACGKEYGSMRVEPEEIRVVIE